VGTAVSAFIAALKRLDDRCESERMLRRFAEHAERQHWAALADDKKHVAAERELDCDVAERAIQLVRSGQW
jgi:hypothetical protein